MNDQTAPATAVDTESGTAKVRIRPDLSRYVRDKSGNGKRTHRTDDFVARTLAGKEIEQIKQGANLLGIDYTKWLPLNVGQQRMLIGNKIRHLLYGAKPVLKESDVTDVFGEPAPAYDEAAAAAGAAEAAAEQTAESADPEEGGEQGSPEPDSAPPTKQKRVYKKK